MRLATAIVAGVALALGFACKTEVGGNGGSADCNPDEWDAPECCSVPDHMPCKGLSLSDCKARAYCRTIEGTPWDDRDAPQSYVGCASVCFGFTTTETCFYDPAHPAACYWDGSGAIPDGWVELPECVIPAGMCGQ